MVKQSIQFPNKDYQMAGIRFTPDNFDDSKKYPAIVVVHPGGGVKEQTVALYAEAMAKFGFITLAFDASYQGESGGLPRYLEDPASRVEDVSCAVDALVADKNVDANRIGVLGVCAGGGYAINSSLFERRIKAVATVSAVDINGLFRAVFGDNPIPALQGFMAQAGEQRTAEAQGADLMTIPYVPNSTDEFTEQTPEYAKEAYDYYRTPRAMCPTAPNKMLMRSVPKIFAFDAFSQVPTMQMQPILLIAGDKADTAYFSENLMKQIAHQNKELYWVKDATHVSLYDYDVPKAMPKLGEFFQKNL